jgi:hypothetical protein
MESFENEGIHEDMDRLELDEPRRHPVDDGGRRLLQEASTGRPLQCRSEVDLLGRRARRRPHCRQRLSADVSVLRTGIVAMQVAQMVYAAVALLYIAATVFHIYMATIGEQGAFESMWNGVVDENWAKQHHSIWYQRKIGKGNVPTAPTDGEQPAPPTNGKLEPAE